MAEFGEVTAKESHYSSTNVLTNRSAKADINTNAHSRNSLQSAEINANANANANAPQAEYWGNPSSAEIKVLSKKEKRQLAKANAIAKSDAIAIANANAIAVKAANNGNGNGNGKSKASIVKTAILKAKAAAGAGTVTQNMEVTDSSDSSVSSDSCDVDYSDNFKKVTPLKSIHLNNADNDSSKQTNMTLGIKQMQIQLENTARENHTKKRKALIQLKLKESKKKNKEVVATDKNDHIILARSITDKQYEEEFSIGLLETTNRKKKEPKQVRKTNSSARSAISHVTSARIIKPNGPRKNAQVSYARPETLQAVRDWVDHVELQIGGNEANNITEALEAVGMAGRDDAFKKNVTLRDNAYLEDYKAFYECNRFLLDNSKWTGEHETILQGIDGIITAKTLSFFFTFQIRQGYFTKRGLLYQLASLKRTWCKVNDVGSKELDPTIQEICRRIVNNAILNKVLKPDKFKREINAGDVQRVMYHGLEIKSNVTKKDAAELLAIVLAFTSGVRACSLDALQLKDIVPKKFDLVQKEEMSKRVQDFIDKREESQPLTEEGKEAIRSQLYNKDGVFLGEGVPSFETVFFEINFRKRKGIGGVDQPQKDHKIMFYGHTKESPSMLLDPAFILQLYLIVNFDTTLESLEGDKLSKKVNENAYVFREHIKLSSYAVAFQKRCKDSGMNTDGVDFHRLRSVFIPEY